MGHADLPRNLSRDHAAFEEVGRLHATLLHGVVITQASTASVGGPSRLLLLYRN